MWDCCSKTLEKLQLLQLKTKNKAKRTCYQFTTYLLDHQNNHLETSSIIQKFILNHPHKIQFFCVICRILPPKAAEGWRGDVREVSDFGSQNPMKIREFGRRKAIRVLGRSVCWAEAFFCSKFLKTNATMVNAPWKKTPFGDFFFQPP